MSQTGEDLTWEEWVAEKLAAFEEWADRVKPEELRLADPERSRELVKLLDDDPEVDRLIEEARQAARQERRESA